MTAPATLPARQHHVDEGHPEMGRESDGADYRFKALTFMNSGNIDHRW